MTTLRRPEDPAVSRDGGVLGRANRWLGVVLVALLSVSGLQFVLYIALTYIVRLFDGDLDRWNGGFLPGLYSPENAGATGSIGLHFVTGAVVMVLGCVQLIPVIRTRWPVVHRWIGRLYVATAILTAIGGLGFIVLQRTVGGIVMDVGFGLYGLLMILSAVQAIRYARARDFDRHRAWAVRLFALVIASWLYRMQYGLSTLVDFDGRTTDFRGWFDYTMDFFFYLPNLAIAELYLRARRVNSSVAMRGAAVAALLVSVAVVAGGAYVQLQRL
ncbi:DUF2306 domain-containing protein [Mycolicibacterium murale]|uniref:DUF2306 domain-containing protein n=1 Tax=Mycolicibacterium murale TaxID=182220 RepID=UPI001877449D|nr:DUF2306 domain-containing protein [Mycolicibacterium murale]MCV7181146.1 DUF2306 domain-containing protein [Mycolicibacterium murale]